MKVYLDYRGQSIRLTEDRRKHILEHPEMKGLMPRIQETLFEPQWVIQSLSESCIINFMSAQRLAINICVLW